MSKGIRMLCLVLAVLMMLGTVTTLIVALAS